MASPEKLSKMRLICMTEVDAEAFSTALIEAFPRMRFVRVIYDDNRELRPNERGWFLKDPIVHKNPYMDSLGDPDEWRFYAFIQPKGWRPRWGGPTG